MELNRVVRTAVPLGGGLSRIGSGYLLAPGLVLTARHVLQPSVGETHVGQPCQVRLWPCGPAQDVVEAEVTWLHQSRDVALLRAQALSLELEPLVWGVLEGVAPVEWTALGYPRASRLEGGDRVEEEAYGTVAPGTEESTGGLGLTVSSRTPAAVASAAGAAPAGGAPAVSTGWAGLSGAAVFCGPALLGIVTADPAQYATSLEGIRTSALLEHDDFAELLGVAAQPVAVRGRPPQASFGAARSSSEPRARDSRVKGDRVSAGVESWRDRDPLLAELRAALVAPPPSQRIISVIGRRGIGKSATVAKVVSEFELSDPNRRGSEDLDAIVNMSVSSAPIHETVTGIVFHRLASLADAHVNRLQNRWEKAGTEALHELWEAMKGRHCVIVLDGLDRFLGPQKDPAGASDLLDLLRSVCSTRYPPRVLTTSVLPLDLPDGLVAHVREFAITRGLRTQDCVALLRSRDPTSHFADLGDDVLGEAVRLLHGIPLGIDLLATPLRNPVFRLHLSGLQAPPDEVLSELVQESVRALTGASRAVVDLLALAGVPLPMDAVPRMLQGVAEPMAVESVIYELVRGRVILFEAGMGSRPHTLRLHQVEGDWCRRTLLAGAPERHVGLDLRLAQWYASQRMPQDQWRSPEDADPQRMEFRHRWRAGQHDAALAVLVQAARFLARKGQTAFVLAAVAEAESVPLTPAGVVARERCRYAVEFLTGSLEVAEKAALLADETAREAGLDEAALEVGLELGTLKRHKGDHVAAVAILGDVTRQGDRAGRYVRLDALFELGIALCAQRRWTEALAAADELAGALQPDELPKLGAGVLDIRALALYGSGDYPGALDAAAAGAAAYLETPYQDDAGYLYNVAGLVRLAQDDLPGARLEFARGEQVGSDFRIDRLVGICATNLAWAELRSGDRDAALAAARRGSTALGSTGTRAAGMPRGLVDLLSAPRPTPDALAALGEACRAGQDDPDLVQFGEQQLAVLARWMEEAWG